MNNFEFQKLINAKQDHEQKLEEIETLTMEDELQPQKDPQETEEDGFKARGNTAEIKEKAD